MSNEKTFTVAGTSFYRGETTLRVANGGAAARQKVLEKGGHDNVRLWDLPSPMSREQAAEWIKTQGADAVPVQKAKEAPAAREKPASKPAARGEQRSKRSKGGDGDVDFWGTDWSQKDMEVSPEVEQRARVLHREGWLGFMEWDTLSGAVRNEYRTRVQNDDTQTEAV